MKTTTIRLPEDLFDKLKQLAKEKGFSLNALVISTLWDRVDNKAPPAGQPGSKRRC